MPFKERDQLKALSIVSVFETSRPLGDYAACVVLNDGAGVSYGICQFTHRSGSLAEVVERYLAAGGRVASATLSLAMPWLHKRTPYAIKRLATSEQFKKALTAAAVTREMKDAQHAVAFQRYLRPALEFCDARGFELALSLAVVYDSIVHGSFDRIASRVQKNAGEKSWITDYVRKRHLWLSNIARLKSTTYRTKFFLDQIAIANWDLNLPLNVHGVRLSEPPALAGGQFANADPTPTEFGDETLIAASADGSHRSNDPVTTSFPTQPTAERAPTPPHVEPGTNLNIIETATGTFDHVDRSVTAVTARTDRAKSLWTTIAGTAWQTGWAIFGWVAGVPREVWVVVAVIVAMLLLFYLYRQISLGKLRESATRQADG
jgi:hypothetical protein